MRGFCDVEYVDEDVDEDVEDVVEQKWSPESTRGPNFLNIPKLTKNIFADFLESIYLPYHVPPLFHDSGVLQKVSFMCSSGVIVRIILLSALMGVPEI